MTQYTQRIASLRAQANNNDEMARLIKERTERYKKMYKKYNDMLQAQRVLATVSDQNSKRVLGYIQETINKSLKAMFPNDVYYIIIEKKLHGNKNPHLNVTLTERTTDGDHHNLDFSLQSGDGMGQIVSFLFTLCLLRIREARPIVALDEVLKGFHEDALPYVTAIIEIFAKGGFQFIMVEYDMRGLGKEYYVRKTDGVAELVTMDSIDQVEFEPNEDDDDGSSEDGWGFDDRSGEDAPKSEDK